MSINDGVDVPYLLKDVAGALLEAVENTDGDDGRKTERSVVDNVEPTATGLDSSAEAVAIPVGD